MTNPGKKVIRVRFAPSPTGYLHIGGARTALFNYLYAKHHQGRFLLRIEDTDQCRSDEKMTESILRSLEWMDLKWDGEMVRQSDRISVHQDICRSLFERGAAYPCFCDSERLRHKREQAVKEKKDTRYDRTCLKLGKAEVQRRMEQGDPWALRFIIPDGGETVFDDMIRGAVCVRHEEIEDFIIQRSDGSPVYQVAVVADDHDMGITHVIRGDDHLSNTPKQILLYQALGWPVPKFAHVPMILGTDKKRLSKRHGAVSVEAYREEGILPECLVNFLALLGWSPGNDQEVMTMDTLVHSFSLERVSKKAAVFDEQKLQWMNGIYFSGLSDESVLEKVIPEWIGKGWISQEQVRERRDTLTRIAALLKPRSKTLKEFISGSRFFFSEPVSYEEKAVKKHWNEKTHGYLQSILPVLESLDHWDEAHLERAVRDTSDNMEISAGKLIHPIRLALTGSGSSPGLFEIMTILGKSEVLERIELILKQIQT